MSECVLCGQEASAPLHDPKYGSHEFVVDRTSTEYLVRHLLSPIVNDITIRVCQQCIELEGAMCGNYECVFCRRTMEEVKEYLDVLLICPIIDGERVILAGATAGPDHSKLRKRLQAGK